MGGDQAAQADVVGMPDAAARLAVAPRTRLSALNSQHVSIFAIEVTPLSAGLLRELITPPHVRQDLDKALGKIRTLHYASMVVFDDKCFDPTLVLEANYDGPAGPFWAELEAAIGPQLRAMLRYCKRPPGRAGVLFDKVTAADSVAPVAPLLEAVATHPTAVVQGTRHESLTRIKAQAKLYDDVRTALGDRRRFRGMTAQAIHHTLREEMLPLHPELAFPAPSLVMPWVWDIIRLFLFLALTLGVLNVPGVLLGWIISPFWAALVEVVALPVLGVLFWRAWHGSRSTTAPPAKLTRLSEIPSHLLTLRGMAEVALGVLGVAAFVAVVEFVLVFLPVVVLRFDFSHLAHVRAVVESHNAWLGRLLDQPTNIATALEATAPGHPWPKEYVHAAFQSVGLGFFGAIASGLYIALRLRALEQRDPSETQSDVDSKTEREIAIREDHGEQNHMASLVHIRPGPLRATVMNASLTLLGLFIRFWPRSAFKGYLVTVRTIHFAHLTLIGNGSRLLFLANFDGTWDNYLVDFIEKVQVWLTLVWTHGLGFPPTRFLIFEGATHGRRFRIWKRRAMAPTLYWFQAYDDLSVETIRRQGRIADGLRQPTLSQKGAATWAMDL